MNLRDPKKPFIIAGPCSAETEEQIFSITQKLAASGLVDLIRAGVWKPRTRPGNFEGIGQIGLDWMVRAGKEYNIKVATEVANANHVEEALKAGIDALWIGARTVSNPFSVQEIADALKGSNVPVFIKNAINPDLNLWVGAIERIQNSGIQKVTAIHRGFSSYQKTRYRNEPLWNIPIRLMQIFPDVPIMCDPSHICGNTEYIPYIAQQALDMNMDGLMIETHPDPDNAWSDKAQQLTPNELIDLLNNLNNRVQSNNESDQYILAELRLKIDELDELMVNCLAKRFQVVEDIAAFKKHRNLTVLQINRWSEILQQRVAEGKALGLRAEFIVELLEIIHNESVLKQSQIINQPHQVNKIQTKNS